MKRADAKERLSLCLGRLQAIKNNIIIKVSFDEEFDEMWGEDANVVKTAIFDAASSVINPLKKKLEIEIENIQLRFPNLMDD